MISNLMAKKRLAGVALILALGATGVACEGDASVDLEDGGGENGGGEDGGVEVEGEVGGEGEGEGGEGE